MACHAAGPHPYRKHLKHQISLSHFGGGFISVSISIPGCCGVAEFCSLLLGE
uniref:Uncharacterized protein n=1 Tax=Ciona intestinalis TaxID=7719 RepID=H2XJW8_CIOIN